MRIFINPVEMRLVVLGNWTYWYSWKTKGWLCCTEKTPPEHCSSQQDTFEGTWLEFKSLTGWRGRLLPVIDKLPRLLRVLAFLVYPEEQLSIPDPEPLEQMFKRMNEFDPTTPDVRSRLRDAEARATGQEGAPQKDGS